MKNNMDVWLRRLAYLFGGVETAMALVYAFIVADEWLHHRK